VNLYKPFLGTSFKKARVQYTVLSQHKYPHPIGFIAVKRTAVNADYLEIALVHGLEEKYYSFLTLQKLFQTLPIQRYGWTVHKANLPSIKLLAKLGGGFYEKTVKNKKRIEAEGFFRVNGSQPVSKKMQDALKELLPRSEEQFNLWLNEFNSRNMEQKALYNYLEGFGT
ncbi:MAG: GNAT family N-acetyltransferase, partial [bacterium]|nr:GNAT family N-acetyltransferase [bacterium]